MGVHIKRTYIVKIKSYPSKKANLHYQEVQNIGPILFTPEIVHTLIQIMLKSLKKAQDRPDMCMYTHTTREREIERENLPFNSN